MNHVRNMKPSETATVKSVDRALDLLELLAASSEPVSFLDLSRRLGIPKSSLFHLLGNMIARGYVEQLVDIARFRLGGMPSKLIELAAQDTSLAERVAPILRSLSAITNESSTFYVPEGDLVRGVVVEHGTHALSYRIAPDAVVPLYAFSGGKVVLASYDEARLADYLERIPRERFTDRTLVDAAALRSEIEGVRRTGVGRSWSEFAVGVAGIGMAVCNPCGLIGVVNVSIPQPRLDERASDLIIRSLRAAVSELEDVLATYVS